MKYILFLLSVFIIAYNSNAQTMEITGISDNVLCSGEQFEVTYEVDATFNDNNVFVVQLSYPDGDFSNFYNIGNLKTQESGTIQCTVPDDMTVNDAYRLRLISSNPYRTGAVYDADIAIYGTPSPSFKFDDFKCSSFSHYSDLYVFNDQGLKISNTSTDDGEFYWEFGENADPQTYTGYTPPLVNYSEPGNQEITLTNTNAGGCSESVTFKAEIKLIGCNPVIDSSSIVINIDTVDNEYNGNHEKHFWICSDGSCDLRLLSKSIIYVEPGGTLRFSQYCSAQGNIIYLKPGACLDVQHFEVLKNVIIKAPGSSINYNDINEDEVKNNLFVYECDDLVYEYDIAPEEGKIAMQLGVDDRFSDNSVNISPNPCNGHCKVTLNDDGTDHKLILSTLLGEIVMEQEMPRGSGNYAGLDLSGLGKGIYILKVVTDKSVSYKKIIFQ